MSDTVNIQGATILVVDDEPYMVKLLESILTKAGHSVITTSSGRAAIEIAQAAMPDLILMDISMPNMDGYEVTAHIKQYPKLQDIPVIFLSGRSEEEDGGRFLAIGGAVFLHKPFKVNQIRDVVGLALRSQTKFQRNTARS